VSNFRRLLHFCNILNRHKLHFCNRTNKERPTGSIFRRIRPKQIHLSKEYSDTSTEIFGYLRRPTDNCYTVYRIIDWSRVLKIGGKLFRKYSKKIIFSKGEIQIFLEISRNLEIKISHFQRIFNFIS